MLWIFEHCMHGFWCFDVVDIWTLHAWVTVFWVLWVFENWMHGLLYLGIMSFLFRCTMFSEICDRGLLKLVCMGFLLYNLSVVISFFARLYFVLRLYVLLCAFVVLLFLARDRGAWRRLCLAGRREEIFFGLADEIFWNSRPPKTACHAFHMLWKCTNRTAQLWRIWNGHGILEIFSFFGRFGQSQPKGQGI